LFELSYLAAAELIRIDTVVVDNREGFRNPLYSTVVPCENFSSAN